MMMMEKMGWTIEEVVQIMELSEAELAALREALKSKT
jgi:plasmid maintenance system antidote protein VapI